MRLGKDFFFWLKVLIAILNAIKQALSDNPGSNGNAGPTLVKSVLDVIVKANDDDSFETVDDVIKS